MPDLAVPHLAFRQPNIRPRGVDQRVGISLHQVVVGRLAREGDSIALRHGRETPAVQDRQDQRLRFGHLESYCRNAFLPG